MKNVLLRPEASGDGAAIRRVNELAFGRHGEADLVDALRGEARPFVSLVAVQDGQVVGHICFSPVTIESEDGSSIAMGLAPMAVLPGLQRGGIGSALVREGLEECRRMGQDVVVVLGHPEYYPRFGFVPASRKGLRSEYDVPDEVFLVAELRPGALAGRQGLVRYHPAFAKV
ncbi:MAG TPA: N-acetyltransferase [Thermoanaerobaculia bacterium]|nr:N-acetyltransferase [Thermoanaerobaculia bacterium]